MLTRILLLACSVWSILPIKAQDCSALNPCATGCCSKYEKTLGMYEHEEARMVWLTWLLIDRDTVVLGTIIAYAPSTMWLIYMALPISNLVSFPPTG